MEVNMTATALAIPARKPRSIPATEVIYPDSDGQPMADNTRQFRYIVTIQGGVAAMFADRPDVFVAGDLLWYPVEGDNTIRAAPDTMVVFGRPPGDRGSYMQWREEGLAPQVTFEVLSPGNTRTEMTRKRQFYERYGVEEYYEYDPDRGTLKGWLRQDDRLESIPQMEGWISPRLGGGCVLRWKAATWCCTDPMGDALRPSSNWSSALRPNASALRPNASKAARKDYRKACNRRWIG
jgi:Uma2 family endonuclease